jgi:hypothetical protein
VCIAVYVFGQEKMWLSSVDNTTVFQQIVLHSNQTKWNLLIMYVLSMTWIWNLNLHHIKNNTIIKMLSYTTNYHSLQSCKYSNFSYIGIEVLSFFNKFFYFIHQTLFLYFAKLFNNIKKSKIVSIDSYWKTRIDQPSIYVHS